MKTIPMFGISRGQLLGRTLALVLASSALCAQVNAQDAQDQQTQNQNGGRGRRGQNGQNADGQNGPRGNFNPEEMQQRQAQMMREQLGITDDAEWNLISQRVTAINELRRATMGGGMGMGMRGFGGGPGGPGGQGGQRGNRFGAQANPEADALRTAVTDKLPDAEVKARLARLREVRKQNEEKLAKAQEELRAVLTVRQEAAAVLMGLLP